MQRAGGNSTHFEFLYLVHLFGVLHQYLGSDLITHGNLLEVLQPFFRHHVGEVSTEHHLILDKCVGIVNKGSRIVFGGYQGQVQVNVPLVQHDGQLLLLPWPGRMSHDNGQLREVGGNIIKVYGLAVFLVNASSPWRAHTHIFQPRMEDGRQPKVLTFFPYRVKP